MRYLAVGKSCLLNRYLGSKFKNGYEMTVGVEFGTKCIKVEK